MTLEKIARKIHLWLGLSSGLVILILGITGCILAFEMEIRNLAESFRKVTIAKTPYLSPTALKAIAEKNLSSGKALAIEYPGNGKAAIASYYDATHYELVFINPYSGEMLKHKNMNNDFFRIVLDGHYYLWLPHPIGQPVSAYATLVFLIMMITGLILWWPKNRAARKQRFTIRWTAGWRRKNYDLHNVPGFYMTWISIFIAITGLVLGLQWFAKSVYWITSGGNKMTMSKPVVSDTTKPASFGNMTDYLWNRGLGRLEEDESIAVYFAGYPTAPVELIINHRPGTYYDSEFLYYDQYTGKQLFATGSYAGKFKHAKTADKIVRMNYDIHVGTVLGFPGKILVFFASLVAASLPVTGFLIWKGRRKKHSGSSLTQQTTVQTPAI